jgi:hypothetical protein
MAAQADLLPLAKRPEVMWRRSSGREGMGSGIAISIVAPD